MGEAISYKGSRVLDTGATVQGPVEVSASTPLPVASSTAAPSAVQGTAADGAAAAGNPVQVGGVDASGNVQALHVNTSGGLAIAYRDGTAGSDGINQISGAVTSGETALRPTATALYIFNGTAWDKARKANATSRIASAAASTNATSAKASAGNVHNITAFNAAGAVRFLKLYNKASAPTVGTDTPVQTIAIPAGQSISLRWDGGLYFSTGIAYALTTGAADADTGALTAADVVGLNISYS